jgi:rRNA maturation endonuclease Nob1
MTPQEAIETIKIAQAEVEWNYPMDYAVAFDEANKALQKQVPTKPVKKSFIIPYDGIDVCANCKKPLPNKSHNYCSNCGQRIDWSEEKEG